jgi:oligoribonuclease NrnB/cAMP/cGMP phosphodiesterase (DHH superfamily)
MICIYHSRDLDGWCSAAIVKKWFEETKQYGALKLLGWDYGDPIPDLSSNETKIIVDISFPVGKMIDLLKYSDVIWIDHHISVINDFKVEIENMMGSLSSQTKFTKNYDIRTLHLMDHKMIFSLNDSFSACELTWKYLFPNEKMPEFVRLLGRYDCFGHKGTEEEQKVLEFQYFARAFVKNPEDCYRMIQVELRKFPAERWMMDNIIGTGIYQYLCTEALQIYSNIFAVHYAGYKIAAVNRERFNPVNFGIDYHKDGYDAFLCFHYAKGKWNFSLYNDNGKVDCSVICKQFGGGGHKGAAGFVTENINFLFEINANIL